MAPLLPYVAVLAGLYVLHSAWLAMLFYHLGVVVILGLDGRRGLLGAVVSGWHPLFTPLAGIVFAAGGFLLLFLWPYVHTEHLVLADALAEVGLAGGSWWTFAVYFVVVSPLLEEVYWRRYLAEDGSLPGWKDVVFAGYHILTLQFFLKPLWVVVVFLMLIASAWMWRLATRRFGGLGVPIASHTAADVGAFAALALLVLGLGEAGGGR